MRSLTRTQLIIVYSTLKGVEGVSIADEFDPEPKVYLAMAVPKFPNYFVVNGVRGNWAAGTALPSVSLSIRTLLLDPLGPLLA